MITVALKYRYLVIAVFSSNVVSLIGEFYSKIMVMQCLFSRYAPCVSPFGEFLKISACPFRSPSRHTARGVVHSLKV
jgi:hypothetical protein